MKTALQQLLDFKNTVPSKGNIVGQDRITTYHDILISAHERTGHNFTRFFVTDALRAMRVSPESPIEYFCAKTIFLREVEHSIDRVRELLEKTGNT